MTANYGTEHIVWQSADGTWNTGFYPLVSTAPVKYEYFTQGFAYTGLGHSTLEAALADWPDENDPGVPPVVLPHDDAAPNDRLDFMAAGYTAEELNARSRKEQALRHAYDLPLLSTAIKAGSKGVHVLFYASDAYLTYLPGEWTQTSLSVENGWYVGKKDGKTFPVISEDLSQIHEGIYFVIAMPA